MSGGSMPHLTKCALVHGLIDSLARADPDIGEMVREDRLGFEGPGLWAPVDHVVVYADDLKADVTDLTALQTMVAIAQMLDHVVV